MKRPTPPLPAVACVLALAAAACAEEAQEAPVQDAAEDAAETLEADAAVEPEAAPPGAEIIANAPDAAWRPVDPENLLKITTTEGVVWVELAPAFAPTHAARMRELARMDWYDFKVWHRVIDGFMAQGGGARDNPSVEPPTAPMASEFVLLRGAEMEVSELQARTINPRENRGRAQAGFWNGFRVGTQPIAQAAVRADGQVESWLLHCDGAAAMARTGDPNSANAQFYIVRGDAEHLNTIYTVWGATRSGLENVYALNVGTLGETRGFSPSFIEDVEVASDLDAAERVDFEVMDTNSETFAAYLDALRAANGGDLPDICDIAAPVRAAGVSE